MTLNAFLSSNYLPYISASGAGLQDGSAGASGVRPEDAIQFEGFITGEPINVQSKSAPATKTTD